MSDKVQFNMEKMAAELEAYRKFEIFTKEEISDIVETRRKYEYRLQRSRRRLGDYLHYIKYEMSLEEKKEAIRNRQFVGSHLCNFAIPKRIMALLADAMAKFPDDPMLFVQFIDYAMEKGFHDELRTFFGERCLRNVRDVHMWIFCASKLIEMGDFSNARVLMQKGIRINRNSAKIRLEHFRLEIMYIEHLRQINEQMGLDGFEDREVDDGALPYLIFCELYVMSPDCNEISEMIALSKTNDVLYSKIRSFLGGRERKQGECDGNQIYNAS